MRKSRGNSYCPFRFSASSEVISESFLRRALRSQGGAHRDPTGRRVGRRLKNDYAVHAALIACAYGGLIGGHVLSGSRESNCQASRMRKSVTQPYRSAYEIIVRQGFPFMFEV